MFIRVPTRAEYESYEGAHTHQLWKLLPETWHCPECGRAKFELLRWTKRVVQGRAFDGWTAALHGHHDHLGIGRFPETIICELCNTVDGMAKRRRTQKGITDCFSFSPAEMRRFITATPHGTHVVDWERADALYERLRPIATWALINHCVRHRFKIVPSEPGRVQIFQDRWTNLDSNSEFAQAFHEHSADIYRAIYPDTGETA